MLTGWNEYRSAENSPIAVDSAAHVHILTHARKASTQAIHAHKRARLRVRSNKGTRKGARTRSLAQSRTRYFTCEIRILPAFFVNRAVATDQTLLAASDHVVDIGCNDE